MLWIAKNIPRNVMSKINITQPPPSQPFKKNLDLHMTIGPKTSFLFYLDNMYFFYFEFSVLLGLFSYSYNNLRCNKWHLQNDIKLSISVEHKMFRWIIHDQQQKLCKSVNWQSSVIYKGFYNASFTFQLTEFLVYVSST